MTLLIALIAAAAVVLAVAARLVHEIRSDGYGHHEPPRSHREDYSPAPARGGPGLPG